MSNDLFRRAAHMSTSQLALAAASAGRQTIARAEPIGVIGAGCRFPASIDSPDQLWSFLRRGGDAITPIPQDRFDIDAYYDPEPGVTGRIYVRDGAFFDNVTDFDARQFAILPRDAISIDPQQRILLEVTWRALEHAGLRPSELRGSRTGVWVGAMHFDYGNLLSQASNKDLQFGTGTSASILAGRLSHSFGFTGPSITINTACSSSLVALHLAVQALRAGTCDRAVVAGINAILSPLPYLVECQMRMLSPSGRCRSFDAMADGFVRGEGCGVIVLERLSDALSADSRVLGVVRGSAVNHDGANSGLTVPNGASQESLIRSALIDARVLPEQVGVIEAHGTATTLGDLIELAALGRVYGGGDPLWVRSSKTNLGHTEGAAGITGVLSALLMLQNGEIAPSLHFTEPNPRVAWDSVGLRVNKGVQPLRGRGDRKIVGVSSFGFSGTNAHVLLESAIGLEQESRHSDRRPLAVAFSGRTKASLAKSIAATSAWLEAESNAESSLDDIATTSLCRRDHLGERLMVLVNSVEELRSMVSQGDLDTMGIQRRARVPAPRLAWILAGPTPFAELSWMGESGVKSLVDAGLGPSRVIVLDGGADAVEPVTRALGQSPQIIDARRSNEVRKAIDSVDAVFTFGAVPQTLTNGCTRIEIDSWSHFIEGVAALHCAGLELSWERLLGDRGAVVDLPGIQFDRDRYWPDLVAGGDRVHYSRGLSHHIFGCGRTLPGSVGRHFDGQLVAQPASWWTDGGQSSNLDIPRLALLMGAWELLDSMESSYRLETVEFGAIPGVEPADSIELHAIVQSKQLTIHARKPGAQWCPVFAAAIREGVQSHAPGLDELKARLGPSVPVDSVFAAASMSELGPRLRSLSTVWELNNADMRWSWLARLKRPERLAGDLAPVHASLLESAMHLVRAAAGSELEPAKIAEVNLFGPSGTSPWLYVCGDEERLDVFCYDDTGVLAASLLGIVLERRRIDDGLVEFVWRSISREPNETSDSSLNVEGADRHESPESITHTQADQSSAKGQTVIWAQSDALGEQLALRLQTSIPEVKRVDSIAALNALLEDQSAARVEEVVYCLDVPRCTDHEEPEDMYASEVLVCDELLPLIQVLAASPRSPRLRIVSQGAVGTPTGPVPGLGAAVARGLVDVARVELPELQSRLIDLDPSQSARDQLDALVTELVHARHDDGEALVALRQQAALVPRIVARGPATVQSPWKPRSGFFYLVSGGFEGFGRFVARWLIERGASHVALMDLVPLDAAHQDELNGWCTSESVHVQSLTVDFTNRASLEHSLESLRRQAPLAGVFLCPEPSAESMLRAQTRASMMASLSAKVHAGWALHQVTRGDSLEQFVIFGSSVSFLSTPGQAADAAVNAFDGALAAHRRSLGLPAMSINWGPWIESENASRNLDEYKQHGLRAIDSAHGLELLADLCQENPIHVGVIPRDDARLRALAGIRVPALLRELFGDEGSQEPVEATKIGPNDLEQILVLPAAEGLELLTDYVHRWLVEVLRWPDEESLDPRAALTSLGLDSLMAINLRNRLVNELQIEVALETLIEHASLTTLCAELHERLALARLRSKNRVSESEEMEIEEIKL